MEIFKDIPGYEGIYQASTEGRIKSLANNKSKKEKFLRGGKNARGYLTVNLKGLTLTVHQLVAVTFLNHNFCGYDKVVDHINNNRLDNRLDNLKVISQRENVSKSKNNLKSTGIKKSGSGWEIKISFSSIDSEKKAIFIREKLIEYGNSLK